MIERIFVLLALAALGAAAAVLFELVAAMPAHIPVGTII